MENQGIKKEFAKIFDLYESPTPHSHKKELREPTWAEIFTEIGKLQERAGRDHLEERLDRLRDMISCTSEDLGRLEDKINN